MVPSTTREGLTTHGDGAILVWNVAERKRVANFNEHSGPVRAVAFSPDGEHIASASEDHSIIIWDAEWGTKEDILAAHTVRLTGVSFSPDGKRLASCDQGGTGILWDLEQRPPQEIVRFKDEAASNCVAISPDHRWVAMTSYVFESSDGHPVVSFRNDMPSGSDMYGVAFSPDGRLLVCVTSPSHIVSLWDTDTWQVLDRVQDSTMSMDCVSFSPDGKRLVTGDVDGTVRLWNTSPLEEVALLGRHSSRVKSVAFSPDGSEVASSGDDKAIRLWDVTQRRLLRTIGTHTAPVLSVAFSPDGKRLVSGEHDKSVRIHTRRRTLWGYRWD